MAQESAGAWYEQLSGEAPHTSDEVEWADTIGRLVCMTCKGLDFYIFIGSVTWSGDPLERVECPAECRSCEAKFVMLFGPDGVNLASIMIADGNNST